MSVFTPLSDAQLSAVLKPLGYQLQCAQPALHGIENTNYLIQAVDVQGQPIGLVLTVLESMPARHLPWFVELLDSLAKHGLPVPMALAPPLEVAGKPALFVPWLTGSHVVTATPAQCRAIGVTLGQVHQTPLPAVNALPDQARDATSLGRLSKEITLLPMAIRQHAEQLLRQWQNSPLPEVLIHGDLFRDNALFTDNRLTGLLDFYAAGQGPALYDLAVAINDWCMLSDEPSEDLQQALLEGYQSVRPLTDDERQLIPLALCIGALRFWLSRLLAEQRHQNEALADTVTRKEPQEFQRRFFARLAALKSQKLTAESRGKRNAGNKMPR